MQCDTSNVQQCSMNYNMLISLFVLSTVHDQVSDVCRHYINEEDVATPCTLGMPILDSLVQRVILFTLRLLDHELA